MDGERVEAITDWDATPVDDGHAGLRALVADEFSGAVTDGTAWALLTNGRVVGVVDGTVDDFAGAELTAYRAPDDGLPLLFAMQERGGETRARYYTEDTPISAADEKLSDAGFTGYLELSENVLSGDYYLVYSGGESTPLAFIGGQRRLLTGDEAFERADDEVGIYEVRDVDVEVVEVPDGPSPSTAGGGVGGSAGSTAGDEPGGPVDDADASGVPDATGEATDDADGTSTGEDPGDAAGRDAGGDVTADAAGADDLVAVRGVGPAYADELRTAGVESVADLADADPADLASATDIAKSRLSDVVADARDRVDDATDEGTEDRTADANADADAGATDPSAAETGGDAVADAGEGADGADAEAAERDGEPGGADADASPGDAPEVPATGRSEAPAEPADATGETEGRSSDGETGAPEESDPAPTPESGEVVVDLDSVVEADESTGGFGVGAESADRIAELEATVEDLRERLETVRAERDDLRERVEELEARETGEAIDGETLTAPAALSETNLFVRYRSRADPTLADARDDGADSEAVNENLRIEVHAGFDADSVVVDGRPYEEFLRGTVEYRFVEWLVRRLPYEIRDAGGSSALPKLHHPIPRFDRIELDGTVPARTESGDEAERTFDVVVRDRKGEVLAVANVFDGRDPVDESMVATLVDDARSACAANESLGAAFVVTTSYYEPSALERVESATASGGFLGRENRESYVRLDRSRGFHCCLVEARDDDLHLGVPEL